MTKSVLISIPNLHWIHKLVVHKMLLLYSDGRYKTKIIMPSHKPFENNLHHIIVDFIKGNYDYWLTIDADNPPLSNPLDLVELDKDIIGCPTPILHADRKHLGDFPFYLNAYDYIEDQDAYKPHSPMEGLQKVDAVGTGCVLFAQRVFKCPALQKGAFLRKLNPDGTVDKGNDISFCERAKEQGFEIFAHYDYQCSHENECDLNELVNHIHAFVDKNYKAQ
tara:strand:- start:6649 stop:7311 length:663 start_codon:yes stop_codon:yes gene_type:complete